MGEEACMGLLFRAEVGVEVVTWLRWTRVIAVILCRGK